jgi:8-oxo-dGTP pyrophosphatase MutT (NUDIX family)
LVFPGSDALFEPHRRVGHGRPRRGLADDVALPAYVVIEQDGSSDAGVQPSSRANSVSERLIFIKPSWLYENVRHKDRLGVLGPSYSRGSYTACNVLITRYGASGEEILLARRMRGTGSGTYAMPGGKKLPSESAFEGARRELQEETGLRLIRAEPISLRHNEIKDGRQIVTSIGLLATAWEGRLVDREPEELGPWTWYRWADLPSPIFGPTLDVLRDYKDGGPRPTWAEVNNAPRTLFDSDSDE